MNGLLLVKKKKKRLGRIYGSFCCVHPWIVTFERLNQINVNKNEDDDSWASFTVGNKTVLLSHQRNPTRNVQKDSVVTSKVELKLYTRVLAPTCTFLFDKQTSKRDKHYTQTSSIKSRLIKIATLLQNHAKVIKPA